MAMNGSKSGMINKAQAYQPKLNVGGAPRGAGTAGNAAGNSSLSKATSELKKQHPDTGMDRSDRHMPLGGMRPCK
jgi:hypothetical protein